MRHPARIGSERDFRASESDFRPTPAACRGAAVEVFLMEPETCYGLVTSPFSETWCS